MNKINQAHPKTYIWWALARNMEISSKSNM